MIPISQIDPELSIYKNNTVIIWGAGRYGKEILKLLKSFQVKVAYFCDTDTKKWKTEIEGVPVILPQELMKMQIENVAQQKKGGGDILVQIAMMPMFEEQVRPQVEAMGLEKVICYEEAWQMLGYYLKCDNIKLHPEILGLQKKSSFNPDFDRTFNEVLNLFSFHAKNPLLFICQIPKSGDQSMMKTMKKNQVLHQQTHYSVLLNKDYIKQPIKVTVAIREPISRDISSLYQIVSKVRERNLFKKKNDIQGFFDNQLSKGSNKHFAKLQQLDETSDFFQLPHTKIEIWFESFKKNVLDIRNYPFDQEKGYTIIKEGNYDIFFYQLEKLNDLVPELSEWVGVPFTELVMGNEASSKWIAKSYKQAQKELKFSQDYFDSCYNDPYVQHCYSQEDIEKFKERWRGNIDPNK